jgi:hypothetical protein
MREAARAARAAHSSEIAMIATGRRRGQVMMDERVVTDQGPGDRGQWNRE